MKAIASLFRSYLDKDLDFWSIRRSYETTKRTCNAGATLQINESLQKTLCRSHENQKFSSNSQNNLLGSNLHLNEYSY